MSVEYRVGDVFDRLAEIPDGSIDLVVSSPPFLALRSYLPADHPDKHREIGSEPTPAEFIDTLLALTAEFDRVLAPHGSICIELGDTFSGSGGAGGDYAADGLRGGQGKFKGSASRGGAWPLAKSLTGIPTLYTWSLAYGRNLLTGQPSPAGQWRIRNVIVWARPNPPVGALGDKFRPSTSYITVACKGAKRYFDLDAVRTAPSRPRDGSVAHKVNDDADSRSLRGSRTGATELNNPAGAPPLDWHADDHPEDGDWLWKLSTQPYAGSHYATFPMALPKRMIEAMCPQRVCTTCGKASERIVDLAPGVGGIHQANAGGARTVGGHPNGHRSQMGERQATTIGWTDCGHGSWFCAWCAETDIPTPTGDARRVCTHCGGHEMRYDANHWRTGVVLDPFAGSGTTLEAAQAVGRHAIGIDLDARNADLARERVGMFLDVVEGAA